MSLLNVKLSDKLVTKESQLTPLEIGQFISGLDFGDVKNGDLSSDVNEFFGAIERGEYIFINAEYSPNGIAVLGGGKDEVGCALFSVVSDDSTTQFTPIYSDKSRQIVLEKDEVEFSQGWQNLVNGKFMFPNDIIAKIVELNTEIDGWNGVIVGAIKSEYALESKEVSPRIGDITLEPSEGYYGFSSVTVKSVENGLQSKVVEPQKTNVIVEPDPKYFGMSRVVVNSVANRLQEKVVEPQLSNTTISADSEFVGLSQVTVRSVADKLQEKQVQPQKESTIVTPDYGKLGLSEVTVGAVTSDIDSNIIPENIKSGVEILGVQGTMQGALEITDFSYFHYFGARLDLLGKYDTSKSTKFNHMFFRCNLTEIPPIDTSKGTTFDSTFAYCGNLTEIPPIDTSKSKSMASTFVDCKNIQTIPTLDTRNSTLFPSTFGGCERIITIPTLDIGKGTYFYNTFNNCRSLQNLTLLNIRIDLQIGSGTTWGHLLTVDSLTQIISELIKDSNGTAHTLTVGSANLEKLANVYVRLTVTPEEDTTGKLPFEVCTSTDEGAILITEYATLKNWNIK